MAIIILEKTICPVCSKVIKEGQEIVSFPSFVSNQDDPLLFFNDAAFHQECFNKHPLKNDTRIREVLDSYARNLKICWICHYRIEYPEDYIGFFIITTEKHNPLFKYNHAQFHRSCLRNSPEFPTLLLEIEGYLEAKPTDSRDLKWLLDELRKLSQDS